MCGICGIVNLDGRPVDRVILEAMNRTLTHRGPDEEGYFINAGRQKGWEAGRLGGRKAGRLGGWEAERLGGWEAGRLGGWEAGEGRGNVGLGHRRLSIIDLASGQQPLCNEDGSVWIVFNGEIYNFQALKKELEGHGHRFRTNSDTETIVHGYEQWGEKVFERLRGMFAIALWDERRRQLLLARDRMGKKPLYYSNNKGRLVFGSEIKAVLEAPDVSRDVDLTAMFDYLSLLYVPSPKTIFKAVRKLPAAHYAVVTAEAIRIEAYWDLSFYPQHAVSENQMMDEMIGILDEATRMRMISEVPLGAFLSGGVDSSGVVALMARASNNPVKTNSISFSVAKYNEIEYARKVANLFGTDHHEFHVTPDAIRVIEKLAWHYDEPFADSSAVPTYYVSETARKNVTVSLSGDGGDENFAGYRRYYFDLRENYVRNLVPEGLRRAVFGTIGKLYPKADYLPQIFRGKAFISNVARDPVDAYYFSVSSMYGDEKRRLLHPDILREIGDYRTRDLFYNIYKAAPAPDHLSKIQYLDIKTYLCDDILTKVDRASMAVSLEVRCPILDHVFMEYVAKIPSKHKLVGTDGKHIFKKALKKYLPDEILYRKKMGFGVPVEEWLRKDLKEYGGNFVLKGAASKQYFQKSMLDKFWNEHQKGLRNRSTELWIIMMLNLWQKNFAA
ncbi:MAG: asparagine synthase (glutamine-hydrolyzing) [Desulfobacterales bacterium]|jgi:asparagine synthase (glutamine-hydrolysing)|nr:asparagine synthase (glutamine-hydrolyzing) [Desulfobacterales bacterium]